MVMPKDLCRPSVSSFARPGQMLPRVRAITHWLMMSSTMSQCSAFESAAPGAGGVAESHAGKLAVGTGSGQSHGTDEAHVMSKFPRAYGSRLRCRERRAIGARRVSDKSSGAEIPPPAPPAAAIAGDPAPARTNTR